MRVRELTGRAVAEAHAILHDLVTGGAALGWVEPPSLDEVRELLTGVAADPDAALVVAVDDGRLCGFGYWRRYARPTHRPHADVEKVAIARDQQGRGRGRQIMTELIAAAREA